MGYVKEAKTLGNIERSFACAYALLPARQAVCMAVTVQRKKSWASSCMPSVKCPPIPNQEEGSTSVLYQQRIARQSS